MLVQIRGVAFQIVLDKELAEELRVAPLHRDEPRQNHRQVKRHTRKPDRPLQRRQLAP